MGSPLAQEKATLVLDEFLDNIKKDDHNWAAYNIKPNFLHIVDDTLEKDSTILPYFEGKGRDLALGFKIDDQIHLLLTNGYA